MKVQNTRMQWIEALRGYGALLVVLTHVVASFVWKGWVIDSAITDYLANGGRAVQLFFIISGFVVFMSLDKKPICQKRGYMTYVFKRYITIFFPFLLVMVLSLVVGGGMSFQTHAGGGMLKIEGYGIALTALGLFGFLPNYISGIVANGWYVGIVWIYYLLAPFIKKFVKSTSGAVKFMFAAFLMRLFAHAVTMVVTLPEIVGFWLDMFIVNQLVFLALGQVLYFVMVKKDRKCMCFDQIALLAMLVYTSTMMDSLMFWGLIMGLFFLCMSMSCQSVLVNKPVLFLGKYSYEIYLTHFFAIMLVAKLLPLDRISGYAALAVGYVIIVLISIVFGVALQKIVEKPKRLALKLVDRLQQ